MVRGKNNKDKKFSNYSLKKLFDEYKKGNIEARDEIFKRYEHYVYEIIEEYKGLGLEDEDLLQSGYEGLINGIKAYSEYIFSIFDQVVKQHIHRIIVTAIVNNSGIYYSDIEKFQVFRMIKLNKDIRELETKYLQTYDRKPTLGEICLELVIDGITIYDIEEMLMNRDLISSVDPRLHEFANGYRSTSITRPTEDEVIVKEIWSELEKLEFLTSHRLEILKRRNILGETLEEVGDKIGITFGRVHQLEHYSHARLRHKGKYLKEYLEEINDYNASSSAIYSLKPRTKSN